MNEKRLGKTPNYWRHGPSCAWTGVEDGSGQHVRSRVSSSGVTSPHRQSVAREHSRSVRASGSRETYCCRKSHLVQRVQLSALTPSPLRNDRHS